MLESDLVHLGTLARAHGLKGEVGVYWHAETLDPLQGVIYLRNGDGKPFPARVTGVRMHKGYPLIAIRGIEDRTAAEALRGHKVLIPRSSLPEPDEGEFYIVDIEGCSVYLAGEDAINKRRFGVVGGVDFSSGQEIWQLRTDDGQEALFPAVPEFVREINIETKTVIIDPPPGLFEIYLGGDEQ